MKVMHSTPDFKTWKHENLAKFAEESYIRMQELEDANRLLRLSVRDALNEVRKVYLADGGELWAKR